MLKVEFVLIKKNIFPVFCLNFQIKIFWESIGTFLQIFEAVCTYSFCRSSSLSPTFMSEKKVFFFQNTFFWHLNLSVSIWFIVHSRKEKKAKKLFFFLREFTRLLNKKEGKTRIFGRQRTNKTNMYLPKWMKFWILKNEEWSM